MTTDVSRVVEAGTTRHSGVSAPGVHLLDVSRRADAHAAIERVRLAVPTGSVCALAGTPTSVDTVMGLLSTRLAPHAGHVLIDGHDTVTATRAARSSLGYVGATPVDWGHLTVAEALDLAARAHAPGHRVDRAQRRRIGDLVLAMDLPGRSRTWCADLDDARSRRLALACALVHGPRVLLLHDPLRGIDAAEQDELAALCRHLAARGMTIVLGAAADRDPEGLDGLDGLDETGEPVDEDEAEDLAFARRMEELDRLGGFADRVLTMQGALLVAGRDLSGATRARRWRVVSWDGAALVAGLHRLGVDHDVVAGGVTTLVDAAGTADGPLDDDGFAGFADRAGPPQEAATQEEPEQTVVEVAIAQDADAASLLAALVAAGVPVHGFLPPSTPQRPEAAGPRALTAGRQRSAERS